MSSPSIGPLPLPYGSSLLQAQHLPDKSFSITRIFFLQIFSITRISFLQIFSFTKIFPRQVLPLISASLVQEHLRNVCSLLQERLHDTCSPLRVVSLPCKSKNFYEFEPIECNIIYCLKQLSIIKFQEKTCLYRKKYYFNHDADLNLKITRGIFANVKLKYFIQFSTTSLRLYRSDLVLKFIFGLTSSMLIPSLSTVNYVRVLNVPHVHQIKLPMQGRIFFVFPRPVKCIRLVFPSKEFQREHSK